MEKIQVKLTRDAVYTICQLWGQVTTSIPQNREQLKNKSIAEKVLIKLHKKQVDIAHKKGNETKLGLEIHEAVVLEELLRPVMCHNTTVYQQAQLRNVLDFINQKTA